MRAHIESRVLWSGTNCSISHQIRGREAYRFSSLLCFVYDLGQLVAHLVEIFGISQTRVGNRFVHFQ